MSQREFGELVDCPTCGKPTGEQCVFTSNATVPGAKTGYSHDDRIEAAVKAGHKRPEPQKRERRKFDKAKGGYVRGGELTKCQHYPEHKEHQPCVDPLRRR